MRNSMAISVNGVITCNCRNFILKKIKENIVGCRKLMEYINLYICILTII